jgi:hypothetical protein
LETLIKEMILFFQEKLRYSWTPGTPFTLAQTQFNLRMQSYQPVYDATSSTINISDYYYQFGHHANSSAGGGTSHYGQQATSSQFGHHDAPFVGVSDHSVKTEANRALISNDDEVKQDG